MCSALGQNEVSDVALSQRSAAFVEAVFLKKVRPIRKLLTTPWPAKILCRAVQRNPLKDKPGESDKTHEYTWKDGELQVKEKLLAPEPGLVLIFREHQPCLMPFALQKGRLVIGRTMIADRQMSSRHAEISLLGDNWTVQDLGSTNGTFIDGFALRGASKSPEAANLTRSGKNLKVLRAGSSLFLLCKDIGPYKNESVVLEAGRFVVGPMLRRAWKEIEKAALRRGRILHICGETGTGKEHAARIFHEAVMHGSKKGPFVAQNCANIPAGMAEAELFGTEKGYGTNVAARKGWFEQADGGTLFMDELAELPLDIQAKLLRVINPEGKEEVEICRLGGQAPFKVRFALCTASNKDLKAEVAAGRFREDLYFRLGLPVVFLPPLRDRLEEIPFLIAYFLAPPLSSEHGSVLGPGAGIPGDVRILEAGEGNDASVSPPSRGALSAHVSLVEECLLRPWPGNVRELRKSMEIVAQAAVDEHEQVVRDRHLPQGLRRSSMPPPPSASLEHLDQAKAPMVIPPKPWKGVSKAKEPEVEVSADLIEQTLKANEGNLTKTAADLGIHRTSLRRWKEKYMPGD